MVSDPTLVATQGRRIVQLSGSLSALLEQVRVGNWVDDEGHRCDKNKAYQEALESLSTPPPKAPESVVSDHLYGFVAWLTTRKEVVSVGSDHECPPIMECLKTYMETNDIGDPSSSYPHTFEMPEGDVTAFDVRKGEGSKSASQ